MKLSLMSDNGTQPTSISFMKECAHLKINKAFTNYNNPKGNADTERMMRTIKKELIWLAEWNGLDDINPAVTRWIDWYNKNYLHSSLGYKSPNTMRILWTKQNQQFNETSPLIAA